MTVSEIIYLTSSFSFFGLFFVSVAVSLRLLV